MRGDVGDMNDDSTVAIGYLVAGGFDTGEAGSRPLAALPATGTDRFVLLPSCDVHCGSNTDRSLFDHKYVVVFE